MAAIKQTEDEPCISALGCLLTEGRRVHVPRFMHSRE